MAARPWEAPETDPYAVVDADVPGRPESSSGVISQLEVIGRRHGLYFTAKELLAAEFPEPRWAVPGLIAEGLNLLVGAPKFGKSWLCLGLAVAVASGGLALNKIPVQQGPVLYAALEDRPARLQSRLEAVLGNDPAPDDLSLLTSLPKMPSALVYLNGWLTEHPDARLVIVDVLQSIRPRSDVRANVYGQDYDTIGALKDLADTHGIALIVVSHTRKAVDESDVFNEVSGSTGLTGAADAVLMAKRARNNADAVLHVTGRDVDEKEYGLAWSRDLCIWSLLDEPVQIATMPATQRTIHTFLTTVTNATPKTVIEATKLPAGTVKNALKRMLEAGTITTDGSGSYAVATPTRVQPATHATCNPDGCTVAEGSSVAGLQELQPSTETHQGDSDSTVSGRQWETVGDSRSDDPFAAIDDGPPTLPDLVRAPASGECACGRRLTSYASKQNGVCRTCANDARRQAG